MCLRLNLGKIHLSNHFELFLRFFDNKKKKKIITGVIGMH